MTESGWLPIDTAPKDGTPVDLFYDGERYTDCWWHVYDSGEGDWIKAQYRDNSVLVILSATHWRPVPPPPEDYHERP